MEYAGARRAEKQRRNIINAAMRETQAAQDQNLADLSRETQNYDPTKRMQDMDAQAAANQTQAQADLSGAAAGMVPTAGAAGATSGDFARAAETAQKQETERLTRLAAELARGRSGTQLQSNEAMRRAGVNSTLNSRSGSARNMMQARMNDAENVQEPWWTNLGRMGRQVAMMYALSGGGAGAAGGGSSTGNFARLDRALGY